MVCCSSQSRAEDEHVSMGGVMAKDEGWNDGGNKKCIEEFIVGQLGGNKKSMVSGEISGDYGLRPTYTEQFCDKPFVRRKPDDEWPRGNVRQAAGAPAGRAPSMTPIAAKSVDRIPSGGRQQKKGVQYDPSFPGFNVYEFDHVFDGAVDVYLEGAEVGDWPTRLCAFNRPTRDVGLVADMRTIKHGGVDCRVGDPSRGGMSASGSHLRRDGFEGQYVVRPGQSAHDIAMAQDRASIAFHNTFAGECVGYEEMLLEQSRLWPESESSRPRHWDVSRNLGNAMHVDADGWRCFAVWGSDRPYGTSDGWFLLFPRHSVAIALGNGTWVSWNGRLQPHCSSVPSVAPDDELLSLFCSLPSNLLSVAERSLEGDSQLADRHAPRQQARVTMRGDTACGGKAFFDTLSVGQKVLYRVTRPFPSDRTPSKGARRKWGRVNHRFVEATVTEVLSDTLRVRDGHGGSGRGAAVSEFTVLETFNWVTFPPS